MSEAVIHLPYCSGHISQIVTGFLMLAETDPSFSVRFAETPRRLSPEVAYIKVEYSGKTLIYDCHDTFGFVCDCGSDYDFYFKRDFSEHELSALPEAERKKIYPLGLNYHVTCKGNPLDKVFDPKRLVKSLLGIKSNRDFTCDKFECTDIQIKSDPVISCFMRLWDPALPDGRFNAEYESISATRVEIIRELKKQYKGAFVGGVEDSDYARKVAPELISDRKTTLRENYLKIMHSSDICIATKGIHGSIGWKFGEYVAAGKAIIAEMPDAELPGDFCDGKNYLRFETADECLERTQRLFDSPEAVYAMKLANKTYYEKYLRPDMLIKRTLDIADGKTEY